MGSELGVSLFGVVRICSVFIGVMFGLFVWIWACCGVFGWGWLVMAGSCGSVVRCLAASILYERVFMCDRGRARELPRERMALWTGALTLVAEG